MEEGVGEMGVKIRSPRLFISHAHEDKEYASVLKGQLSLFGVNAFVAHADIEPSSEWSKEIIDSIKKCDAFVPLLSDSFRDSNSRWPDQECGMAIILRKFMYPISVGGITPYGAMHGIQCERLEKQPKNAKWQGVTLKLCQKLIDRRKLSKAWVIESFSRSKTFWESNARTELLKYLENKKLLRRYDHSKIVTAALKNDQILNWNLQVFFVARSNSSCLFMVFHS